MGLIFKAEKKWLEGFCIFSSFYTRRKASEELRINCGTDFIRGTPLDIFFSAIGKLIKHYRYETPLSTALYGFSPSGN